MHFFLIIIYRVNQFDKSAAHLIKIIVKYYKFTLNFELKITKKYGLKQFE